MPRVVGGRYGLSSKEFTPAMVKAVFDEMAQGAVKGKNHFTVGIIDDVTHTSLPVGPYIDVTGDDVFEALFFGLGADGTVGANKNSIKIIGEETDNYAQGYFVYDSKKSGAVTISHLRFGPRPIRSSYLIRQANFVACHQFEFLERYDMLDAPRPAPPSCSTRPTTPREVWDRLPREVQEGHHREEAQGSTSSTPTRWPSETGMGGRINTIMQTCFFAISGVLPREEAIAQIKKAIKKTYGKKGDEVVKQNFAAVDATLANLHEVKVPAATTPARARRPPIVRRGRARLRPARHGRDDGRQGRPAAGLGLPGRRHLAHRHHPVGEAQHRPGDPRVGREDLHPVQQVRAGLPARRHPRQGL